MAPAAAAAAAAQEFPKKPHFVFPEQASNIQQIPSKSPSNALCKTLIIVVLLLVIPLFPSQAPDFISQSVVTEFWEIIHLLFIGIAVSYGLFGRRTAQMVPEKIVDSRTDDSHAYLSGVSHLYSIFDDGYENIYGPNEQDIMLSYANCECLQRSGDGLLGKGRCAVHSAKKSRSFVSNDGAENICEGNVKNVSQAWCSQYVKGESMVVVSNGKCFLGGSSDFKPLNLPVRSLRSKAVDNDKPDLENRNEPSTKLEARGNDDVKVVKIRGVVPLNLEKKFEEVAGKSPIPWRSRSVRMENGEEMSSSKPPAHYRPHSVGEFEFEHLKSKSLRDSRFSGSPELESSKVENVKRKRVFPVPKIAPLNSEASFNGAKTQPFSIDASSDMNGPGNLENNQKNSSNHSEEEVGKGKQTIESSHADTKSSGIAKVLSRAKSVRTIKPKRYIMNQREQCQIDGQLGRMCNTSETDSLVKRGKGEEPENLPVQNQKIDGIFALPKPKPTLPEFHNEEKQDIDDQNFAEPEEDTESEFYKSSDEDDARTNIDNDAKLEGSEVDRKAGGATTVLKAHFHCEGCAHKISKSIRSFDGVEAVTNDGGEITVVGKVDAAKLWEKIDGKQITDDRNVTEPEKDTGSEFDKISDVDDAGLGSEVDRKADEFIAKFREQIRLQKTLSMEGSSGW